MLLQRYNPCTGMRRLRLQIASTQSCLALASGFGQSRAERFQSVFNRADVFNQTSIPRAPDVNRRQ
jgi:hypothetical protein